MLLVGLVAGRWLALPLGGVAWAVLLLAFGTIGWTEVPAAAALGLVNVAVGVLLHKAMALLARRARLALN